MTSSVCSQLLLTSVLTHLILLQRTKKIMGEKVVKYFEDRVKSRVNIIYADGYQLVEVWCINISTEGHTGR